MLMHGPRWGWCMAIPWHRWRRVRQLSAQSELIECNWCARRWAMNHSVQITLPFRSEVAAFYRERECRRYGRPIVD
jgi:hypothetical protein